LTLDLAFFVWAAEPRGRPAAFVAINSRALSAVSHPVIAWLQALKTAPL
jgi:hypothetical protein